MSQTTSARPPPLQEQERYWSAWNLESRVGELGRYEARLREVASSIVRAHATAPRILEVGCGSGWMAEALLEVGAVVGIDLSAKAIEVARSRCPEGRFYCGDFYQTELPGPFDVVVTADTIAHVADQPRFVDRIASQLAPGGLLLLMTQNSYALKRSSWVPPTAPGQIRRWPVVRDLRRMLAPRFDIRRITTAAPGGATDGIFRVLNSRRLWKATTAAFGEARMTALYERLWLGGEIVVVAIRR